MKEREREKIMFCFLFIIVVVVVVVVVAWVRFNKEEVKSFKNTNDKNQCEWLWTSQETDLWFVRNCVLRKAQIKKPACVWARRLLSECDESRTKREEEEFETGLLWVQVGGAGPFSRRRESLLTDRGGGFGAWSGRKCLCVVKEKNIFSEGLGFSVFSS